MKDSRSHKILIIEDHEQWSERLKESLEEIGIGNEDILSTGSYKKAASLIENAIDIKLIFLNIILDGGNINDVKDEDGWRYDWLKLLTKAKDTGAPVIVITAMNQVRDPEILRETACQFGANTLFKNELAPDTLLKEIKTNLSVKEFLKGDNFSETEKNTIEHLLGKDEIEKTLSIIRGKRTYKREAIILSGRLSKSRIKNLTNEQVSIERNKIIEEILRLINNAN
ncbi:MAG: response regulator [Candidatus Electrothrix sp. AUS1_2]|nr:response regulator [Candidatus Electrothrix sp. AUS1_2]